MSDKDKPVEQRPSDPPEGSATDNLNKVPVDAKAEVAPAAQESQAPVPPPIPPIAKSQEKAAAAEAQKSSEAATPAMGGIESTIKTAMPKPEVAAAAEAEAEEAGEAGELPPRMSPLGLQDATLEYWNNLDESVRIECFKAIDLYFQHLLEDFRSNANQAVSASNNFADGYKHWRMLLIVLTGGLALVNVMATSWPDDWFDGVAVKLSLSFVAAIYAVILALLTNIESFLNYSDKKISSRESRELYLDAYREFEMLRVTHVYPYAYSGQACANFNEIYRRLVIKDTELRRKILQLSSTKPGSGQN